MWNKLIYRNKIMTRQRHAWRVKKPQFPISAFQVTISSIVHTSLKIKDSFWSDRNFITVWFCKILSRLFNYCVHNYCPNHQDNSDDGDDKLMWMKMKIFALLLEYKWHKKPRKSAILQYCIKLYSNIFFCLSVFIKSVFFL